MKVTTEKIENRQAYLTVEMEPSEVESSMDKAYKRLVQRTKVPGFRVGKAPRAILERHIGRPRLLDEALNYLIPEAYDKAVKEQNIESFGQPEIEITQAEPTIFKAKVPMVPIINLGNYKTIDVEPQSEVKISEENINEAIEQLRKRCATWEPVDRSAAYGDTVINDLESTIEDKPFINQKGFQYQLTQTSTFPVPGFAEQLVGLKKGDEKEFKLPFPADYPRADLAGKEPAFKVKVSEVKQEVLPELTDEFVKGLDPKIETVTALREQVAENLRMGAERRAKLDFQERVINFVVGLSGVEYPPALVENEIDRMISRQMQRMQMDRDGLEEYLRTTNKTEEQFRDDFRPAAINEVKRSLVLGKVSDEEKLEITDAEIDAEIDNIVKDSTEKNRDAIRKYMSSEQSRRSIRQVLMGQITVQKLVEIANASSHPEEKKPEEVKAKKEKKKSEPKVKEENK